jgi:hypothetical protein
MLLRRLWSFCWALALLLSPSGGSEQKYIRPPFNNNNTSIPDQFNESSANKIKQNKNNF